MSYKAFREEFRLRNVFFRQFPKDRFVTSPWLSLPVFLSFRLLFAGYFLAIWIWDVSNYQLYPGGKYFIYLANANFTVATLYFVYGSILCIIEFARQCRSKKESRGDKFAAYAAKVEAVHFNTTGLLDHPNLAEESQAEEETHTAQEDQLLAQYKLFWFLYNISASVGLMISIGYWLVIFNGEPVDVRNVTKLVLNFVFLIIETMISNVPVRLYHAVYSITYAALYVVFTVIYWAAMGSNIDGKPYIYRTLDWNNISTKTVILIIMFLVLVIPLNQLLFYGLYKFRSWLETKFNVKSTLGHLTIAETRG